MNMLSAGKEMFQMKTKNYGSYTNLQRLTV